MRVAGRDCAFVGGCRCQSRPWRRAIWFIKLLVSPFFQRSEKIVSFPLLLPSSDEQMVFALERSALTTNALWLAGWLEYWFHEHAYHRNGTQFLAKTFLKILAYSNHVRKHEQIPWRFTIRIRKWASTHHRYKEENTTLEEKEHPQQCSLTAIAAITPKEESE